MFEWAKLDNVAKIFPSVSSHRSTNLYRISLYLDEEVKRGILQDAVEAILPRFPSLKVRMRAGFFWYYTNPSSEFPHVIPDSTHPCMELNRMARQPFLIRIRYHKNRMAVEFNHIITDGMGAMVFVKALLAEYANQRGWEVKDYGDILRPETPIHPEETEDASLKYWQPGIPDPRPLDKSQHLPFRLLPKGQYLVTTGTLPLDRLKDLAREKKVTLTEFLCALHLLSLEDALYARLRRGQAKRLLPLRLVVPVNARKDFPSRTLRNHFLLAHADLDPRSGRHELDEALQIVHHSLRLGTMRRKMLQQISRNVNGEKKWLHRVAPLFLKNMILKQVFVGGEMGYTSSFSNLGSLELPPELAEKVTKVTFIPPPNPLTKIHVGMVSYQGKVYLSFGRVYREPDVERFFFTRLRKLGIPVRIETNY